MKNSDNIFLFGIYSFASQVLFMILECMPQPLRNIAFCLMTKRMGSNILIDYKTYFRYPSHIMLGDNVAINRGCEFFPSGLSPMGTITLGNNVTLSPGVKIYAGGHRYDDLSLPDTASPVVLEDYVWVGANAIILQGVTLGKGAVIGAGAVVTRNIPAFSVAAGNPARVIKMRKV